MMAPTIGCGPEIVQQTVKEAAIARLSGVGRSDIYSRDEQQISVATGHAWTVEWSAGLAVVPVEVESESTSEYTSRFRCLSSLAPEKGPMC
jgi:hypothetical protein